MQDRAALRRQRYGIIIAGASLALGIVAAIALILSPPRQITCIPYALIPQEKICGETVYLFHPNGRKDYMGQLADLAPMPEPPQKRP